jgi:5-methylcytosine-specific restriction protein A
VPELWGYRVMTRRDTGFSPDTKALIEDRAGSRCELCGEYSSDCVAHHRRCRGMGSTRRPETNRAANGLWVCGMDHNRIESHRALSYDNGWLVRQSHTPTDVPVLRRGVWVHLRDNGDIIPFRNELRSVR